MAKPEEFWLERPMSKRDKKMILTLVISIYLILLMTVSSFRSYNLHIFNYVTYYAEFGSHIIQDKINDEHTEFEFKPVNIGTINFGLIDKLSDIKSKKVEEYNAKAMSDSITKQISGKTVDESLQMISNGY